MTLLLILDPKVQVTAENKWNKSPACHVVVCEADLEPVSQPASDIVDFTYRTPSSKPMWNVSWYFIFLYMLLSNLW